MKIFNTKPELGALLTTFAECKKPALSSKYRLSEYKKEDIYAFFENDFLGNLRFASPINEETIVQEQFVQPRPVETPVELIEGASEEGEARMEVIEDEQTLVENTEMTDEESEDLNEEESMDLAQDDVEEGEVSQ